MATAKNINVAAEQASPVFLDKAVSNRKVCQLILAAGNNGVDVVGFPATFIPGYLGWVGCCP